MTDWKKVAERDRQLRDSIDKSSLALAKHRWENTLGAKPKVSFEEYARKCGVGVSAVKSYAKAHELVCSADDTVSISDALVRVQTSAEQYDVVEAIAEARGVTPKAIHAHHKTEVRRVREVARERVEKAAQRGEPTTIKEEAAKIAKMVVRGEKAAKSQASARKSRTDLRYLELEGHLAKARRALRDALNVEVDLADEHRELLADSIEKVRSVLAVVEAKFVLGGIDWDTELAKLNEGVG